MNTFLVNLDSYSGGMYHNYYLYEKDGVSEILPWDLNMSFGGFCC
ncbi:CotH kinase family protein [Paraclostridium bifermentans]|nr:CotH kinase family protein [Paraclostridium bifermentans]